MIRQTWTILALIMLAGLVGRLAWGLTRPSDDKTIATTLPDQYEYLQAGRHLLSGDGLWFWDERFHQNIYASRMPGYPLLIAVSNGRVLVVRCVQALLDCSSVLAIFLLAQRIMGDRRALVAAAVVALNPLLVYFSALLLSETLYTAMLAWSVWLIFRRRKGWIGVMLCAAAAYARPATVVLPVLLCIAVSPTLKRAAVAAALAALAVVLALLPWAYRNHQVLGQWWWLTTNGGVTIYDGIHPGATGASDQAFLAGMPELQRMGEVDRDRYLGGLAQEQIRTDPARFLRLAAVKVARTWSPIPLSDQYGTNRLYIAVGLLFTLPLLLAAGVAIFRSVLPLRERAYLLVPPVLLTLQHAASVGSLRYRVPVEPLLAVLAASICFSTRYSGTGASVTLRNSAP